MMDSQQKPASLLRPGIEPHRLDHHSGLGPKATLGCLCLLDYACASGELIEGRHIDPAHARCGPDCARRRDLKAPSSDAFPSSRHQPQPQSVMMIEQGLHGANELIFC